MNVRFLCVRTLAAPALAALVLAGTLHTFAAEEKAATEAKEDRRGPIPIYYGRVVAPDQKEAIYAIQDKYMAQIAPLAEQIKQLQAQRDKEIEAVLTPEQLAKVKELKAAAVAKAAAGKKPAAKKTTETKPTKPAGGN